MPESTTARRVDWRFEEIVLVCDLVVENGWKGLNRRADKRVAELSRLLRSAASAADRADPTFRNANGVGRKSYDIETAHPSYAGGRTKGGQVTRDVVDAFIADQVRMHELAQAIRGSIDAPESTPRTPIDLDKELTFDEGRTFERLHLARERDPRARKDKIDRVGRTLGYIRCEACNFDFEATYGERGRDFIECHHRNPLSVAGRSKTSHRDLALLCSNCHRMIHRKRPWLTVEQLAVLVATNRRDP